MPYTVDTVHLNFVLNEDATRVESRMRVVPTHSSTNGARPPMFLNGREGAARARSAACVSACACCACGRRCCSCCGPASAGWRAGWRAAAELGGRLAPVHLPPCTIALHQALLLLLLLLLSAPACRREAGGCARQRRGAARGRL